MRYSFANEGYQGFKRVKSLKANLCNDFSLQKIAPSICKLRHFTCPVTRDQESRLYDAAAPSVKLVTMHSSRGLEFAVVCVPGVGYLPHKQSTPEDEARLLYVAMTRAINQLVLTCDRDSAFVQRLEGVLDSKRTATLGSHKP